MYFFTSDVKISHPTCPKLYKASTKQHGFQYCVERKIRTHNINFSVDNWVLILWYKESVRKVIPESFRRWQLMIFSVGNTHYGHGKRATSFRQLTFLHFKCPESKNSLSLRIEWKHVHTTCKRDSKWEFAAWHRELSTPCSVTTRRVWWGRRQEGGSGGRGHMCICGWFLLMCSWGQYNIVEQSFSNNCILFYTSQYYTIIIFDN